MSKFICPKHPKRPKPKDCRICSSFMDLNKSTLDLYRAAEAVLNDNNECKHLKKLAEGIKKVAKENL